MDFCTPTNTLKLSKISVPEFLLTVFGLMSKFLNLEYFFDTLSYLATRLLFLKVRVSLNILPDQVLDLAVHWDGWVKEIILRHFYYKHFFTRALLLP